MIIDDPATSPHLKNQWCLYRFRLPLPLIPLYRPCPTYPFLWMETHKPPIIPASALKTIFPKIITFPAKYRPFYSNTYQEFSSYDHSNDSESSPNPSADRPWLLTIQPPHITSRINGASTGSDYRYLLSLCTALVPPILSSEWKPTSLPLSQPAPWKRFFPR